MKLAKPFEAVALILQEQATSLSHRDIASRLSDAINDHHRENNSWGGLVDVFGDDESGDVVYSCNGDLMQCGYEMGSANGKQTTSIDFDGAEGVHPHTSYEKEADDDDHYAGMEEAFRKGNIYTDLPLYERFISKADRDAAGEGSFAGKGKSFPILQPGDIKAAVRSMGRAGSSNYGMAALKANIIRIARRKGWGKYLPKSWQGDSDSSEARVPMVAALSLQESATTLEPIILKEARADYEIKLIAPGKGSSAFYPAEVLRRDGPKVFTKGTHVYLNHPTAAEEAARPEGDVLNLAGVLSTDAVYHEAHAKGPGLYGRMKVFADHAQMVEDKAPHVGMSIRASGVAEADRKEGGLPVLKELTHAESVDVVTRAGAGGMILTEAAKPASEEVLLTLQEAQDMVKEGVKNVTERLNKRLIEQDAKEEFQRIMEGTALRRETFERVLVESLREIPVKDDQLDRDKFREVVVQCARREAEYVARLSGSGTVRGLGPSFAPIGVTEIDRKAEKKRLKEAKKELKRIEETDQDSFAIIMGGDREAAKLAVRGRQEFVA